MFDYKTKDLSKGLIDVPNLLAENNKCNRQIERKLSPKIHRLHILYFLHNSPLNILLNN